MIVLIDKFTKWIEVEPVRSITALAAIKAVKGIVTQFGVQIGRASCRQSV